jgi:hypothetical protein
MSDSYTRSTDVSGKASDMVREFTSQATNLRDSAADAFSQNASQMKESGAGFAKGATSKVENVLSSQKAVGADYISSIAQAAERAAKEFDTDMPQAAQYIRQASQTINGMADKIREREVRDLVSELTDYARRQPTLVFGGAMLLGFAALRFLKSSAPSRSSMSDGFDKEYQGYQRGHE